MDTVAVTIGPFDFYVAGEKIHVRPFWWALLTTLTNCYKAFTPNIHLSIRPIPLCTRFFSPIFVKMYVWPLRLKICKKYFCQKGRSAHLKALLMNNCRAVFILIHPRVILNNKKNIININRPPITFNKIYNNLKKSYTLF